MPAFYHVRLYTWKRVDYRMSLYGILPSNLLEILTRDVLSAFQLPYVSGHLRTVSQDKIKFYFLLREIGCDYTHSDTVDSCHL